MLNNLLPFLAIAGYLTSTLMIGRAIIVKNNPKNIVEQQKKPLNTAFLVAILASAAHLFYAAKLSHLSLAFNFGLSSMVALISAMLVLIYLLGCLSMPIKRLGILVFPLSALSVLFSYLWSSDPHALSNTGLSSNNSAFIAHILVSILSYCLLAIAAIQSLLYFYQERQIKKRTNPAMLMALPPLQTMELLLFRLIGSGFILLSLALISGAVFSQQIFGQAFAFKHHIILASSGWLVFAAILFRRYKNGLRGSQAVIWTIIGFALIQLGYFGTKIVTESL